MLTIGVCDTLPGWVTPGARMSVGSRTPPSYSQPLPARSGRLQPGPKRPRCRVLRPPLSLKNMTTVFSSSLSSVSLAKSTPTLSSTAATIVARAGLSCRRRLVPSCSGSVGVLPSNALAALD